MRQFKVRQFVPTWVEYGVWVDAESEEEAKEKGLALIEDGNFDYTVLAGNIEGRDADVQVEEV